MTKKKKVKEKKAGILLWAPFASLKNERSEKRLTEKLMSIVKNICSLTYYFNTI